MMMIYGCFTLKILFAFISAHFRVNVIAFYFSLKCFCVKSFSTLISTLINSTLIFIN